MQKTLGITQEKFNELSILYTSKFENHESVEYLVFCNKIQKKIIKALEDKFAFNGYKLVRAYPPKEFLLKPGLYYKVTHPQDFFQLNVISKFISLTSLTRDIRLIDMNFTEEFPDVCILSSEYLNNKIKVYVDKLYKNFQRMKPLL